MSSWGPGRGNHVRPLPVVWRRPRCHIIVRQKGQKENKKPQISGWGRVSRWPWKTEVENCWEGMLGMGCGMWEMISELKPGLLCLPGPTGTAASGDLPENPKLPDWLGSDRAQSSSRRTTQPLQDIPKPAWLFPVSWRRTRAGGLGSNSPQEPLTANTGTQLWVFNFITLQKALGASQTPKWKS